MGNKQAGLVAGIAACAGIGIIIGGVTGGIFFVVGAAAASVTIYCYDRYKNRVRIGSVQGDNLQFQMNDEIANMVPEWQDLDCTDQDLQEVQILTEELLKYDAIRYTCDVTKCVTRDPVYLPCCKKFCEKQTVELHIATKGKCPRQACKKNLTPQALQTQQCRDESTDRKGAIIAFRMRIRKTFQNSPNKEFWAHLIDSLMGAGYVQHKL